jgi:hypothetical protein
MLTLYNELNPNEWDKMLNYFKNSTFDFCSSKILYDIEYLGQRLLANESFVFIGQHYSIMSVIYITSNENKIEISYAGGFLPAPLFNFSLELSNQTSNATKYWHDYVRSLVNKYNVKRLRFMISPMNSKNLKYLKYNWLLKFGYFDRSFNSQFINLEGSVEDVVSGFDRSTKYDLRKVTFETQVLDYQNVKWEDVLEYREIHYDAAGRRTRTLETYKEMYKWISNNQAFLVFLVYDSKRIAVVLISYFNGHASYGSAATLRDYDRLSGIGETMQFAAINYLVSKRLKYYELGHQYFYSDIIRLGVDAKAISISEYKRKFGGETLPIFAGVLEIVD